MGMNPSKVNSFSNSPAFTTVLNMMKLVTTDGKKTVIAEFHQAQGFLSKQEAILEVQPAGMDMLDEIVLTFVLVEQTRRERLELAAKYL